MVDGFENFVLLFGSVYYYGVGGCFGNGYCICGFVGFVVSGVWGVGCGVGV